MGRTTCWQLMGICVTVIGIAAARAEEDPQVERTKQIVLSQPGVARGVASLVQLSRDLEPAAAVEVYRQVADHHLQRGDFNQAAEVLQQLVEQLGDQPDVRAGLLTLMQLYASGEVAHAQAPHDRESQQGFLTYGLHLGQQALLQHADWREDPALAFQCAVALRSSGQPSAAQGWLTPLKHNASHTLWHQRTLAEAWLGESRRGDPPLPVLQCHSTDKSPHLDGVLEEPLWQAPALTLEQPSTKVWLARDDEYLYLAARCEKVAGVAYQADSRPRTYDANLEEHDRIEVQLDIDRDYATAFQLDIDHRGWTADRCWRDTSWNPRWFVAAGGDSDCWTVEAAVPWSQLAAESPSGAWACAIARRLPNAPPAEDDATADFRLLLFE